MNLPQNGRVVVIDDKIEDEGIPIIEALGRKGIAARYFTGRGSTLPKEPIGGVRLLFLDLVLEGLEFTGGDTGQIAASLAGVVGRIIGNGNGPYILIGWTKTPQHLEEVVHILPVKPVLTVDMDKAYCLADRSKIVERIEEKLAAKLQEMGSWQILFRWENLVHSAAQTTATEFYELCGNVPEKPDKWTLLLCRLAQANLGKHYSSKSNEEVIANGVLCLTHPFADTLEKSITPEKFKGIWQKQTKPNDITRDDELNARINARIHLSSCSDQTAEPGYVFDLKQESTPGFVKTLISECFDSTYLKSSYLSELQAKDNSITALQSENMKQVFKNAETKKDEIAKSAKVYFVEVSPLCDHSQKKWMGHRLLPCVAWPATESMHLKKNTDFSIVTPIFWQESCSTKPFYLVFDFRHFQFCPFHKLKNEKPLFRIRKDLINEIQTRLARHVNRPGILSL